MEPKCRYLDCDFLHQLISFLWLKLSLDSRPKNNEIQAGTVTWRLLPQTTHGSIRVSVQPWHSSGPHCLMGRQTMGLCSTGRSSHLDVPHLLDTPTRVVHGSIHYRANDHGHCKTAALMSSSPNPWSLIALLFTFPISQSPINYNNVIYMFALSVHAGCPPIKGSPQTRLVV